MSVSTSTVTFVAGAMTAGYVIAGLFFLRFWTRTRDRLFGAFAVAFWLMGLNQAVVGFSKQDYTETSTAYLLRLAAFLLIIIAVLSKNRDRGRAP